jgi:organic hydroperoxide reductase OsmC/OhrA
MGKEHHYATTVTWTGNRGSGTSTYRAYARDHEISGTGKAALIPGSSDAVFRGDPTRYNPEELLIASLSTCHMLWVLHLCSDAGITVTAYEDEATGVMRENADGSGEFVRVTLRPRIRINEQERLADVTELNHRAHGLCFIARSVNFPVEVEPRITS